MANTIRAVCCVLFICIDRCANDERVENVEILKKFPDFF